MIRELNHLHALMEQAIQENDEKKLMKLARLYFRLYRQAYPERSTPGGGAGK